MASEVPVVRHFVACREVVTGSDGQDVTLRNLIHVVTRLPGEPFPCAPEQLGLYALLTNGRGEHDLSIELTLFDPDREKLIGTVGPVRVDLGQDPVAVLGLPVPLRNVAFPKAGQYTFHLLCDGEVIASENVMVR